MSEPLSPGAYDQLITSELAKKLEGLPAERVLRETLEKESAPEVLARHLQFLCRRAIASIMESDNAIERIKASNRIVRALADITDGIVDDDDLVPETSEAILWGITSPIEDQKGYAVLESPSVRLSDSALLVNARNQPSIGHELKKELTTSDNVDLLCSFVMNSGINVIEKGLRGVVDRGGLVRVLTTVYMGATQKKALDRLVALGAQVRISYDGTTTRLHAKSWLLRRDSGATTAYVGSSNLSHAAMTDGIEWNVRISAREQAHIINQIAATFENYWNDKEFEMYDPIKDGDRLSTALARAGKKQGNELALAFADIEVTPRQFQQEVLDQLEFEREERGRFKNLVVMATGTGKTVVAALDYRRLNQSGKAKSILFVAHRKEILLQTLATFRTVMRDGSFGELFVDGERPTEWKHVFVSVQSMSTLDLERFNRSSFDIVVIDETHHASESNASYVRLLQYFEPKYLLGLTATPERSDGRSILDWFDDGIAAELRLWEAIDRQILSPFQYFGIHDNVDLEAAGVTWRRGLGYNQSELSKVYTGHDARVALILEQMNHYVDDLSDMKALGFCVSVEHAIFMAEKFNKAKITAVSITGDVDSEVRKQAIRDLRNGEIKIIFAVDIFNEGVDIPDVNTLLMLRPTESATVFIQQLGRGLRKSDNKSHLTVLDFVGNQNKQFRFDEKYGKFFGLGKRKLTDAVEQDFPYLPSGCHFELDRVSKDQVLNNLRSVLSVNRKHLISEIRNAGKGTLKSFIDSSGISMEDLYRNGNCLTLLGKEAFQEDYSPKKIDTDIAKSLGRNLHIDDPQRISGYKEILTNSTLPLDSPYLSMFGYAIFSTAVKPETMVERLTEVRESIIKDELVQYLDLLEERRFRSTPFDEELGIPLAIHGRYSKGEIIGGFGEKYTGAEYGITFSKEKMADIAFVTLNKSELHFSTSTMYADTAISDYIFQWESQSGTAENSETGKRYINHVNNGSTFHLFVRDFKNEPEILSVTMPYMYFGPATYMSHEGSKPMRIRFKLAHPIPADVLSKSKVIAS